MLIILEGGENMTNNDIVFIPLGGAQSVGASCYFLKLGNNNIILDAGVSINNGIKIGPDTDTFRSYPFIHSMSEINAIFISHAHMDHVGYLLELASEAKNATIYMTERTYLLAEHQLYDKEYMAIKGEKECLAARSILEKIVKVDYFKKLIFNDYSVTFFPAGHIPGAMMLLFEFKRRKILYTGDYSMSDTYFTDSCYIPKNMNIDTVIMCGLHAKNPSYTRSKNAINQKLFEVYTYLKNGFSVKCVASQLSKGIEFLKIVNYYNKCGVQIYVDDMIMNIANKMEKLHIPIFDKNSHSIGCLNSMEPHVYITTDRQRDRYYKTVNVDFSLHEDFEEMYKFLKRINPKKVYVVHSPDRYSEDGYTIEQMMMNDAESRSQFTFAEKNEIYKI